MNCNTPTDICFSFAGFKARGGATDHHQDGWGIAFFEGRGVRVFLDPAPSAHSPIAALVKHYPIRSLNVIAHIRKATQGTVSLENTHPFQRELWGQQWIFAHNGNLINFVPTLTGRFLPVGNTDSERAFCWMLEQLADQFASTPHVETLSLTLKHLSTTLGEYGEFNFLLSNGQWLFAHCASKLTYIIRQAPFTVAHLADEDVVVDFNQVTTPKDRVAIIATTPLTDNENWVSLPRGTLTTFLDGYPLPNATHPTRAFWGASTADSALTSQK